MKICTKCKKEKSLDDFYERESARDGLRSNCKICFKKASDERKLRTNGIRSVWDSMKSRCCNMKAKSYNRYGGRGISVCEIWSNDFNSFYKWAINNGHKKVLQIDRINNDGNYSPDNCRFVTPQVNSQNRSRVKINSKKVLEIRELLRMNMKQSEIANIYSVDKSTISKINTNEIWSNIV